MTFTAYQNRTRPSPESNWPAPASYHSRTESADSTPILATPDGREREVPVKATLGQNAVRPCCISFNYIQNTLVLGSLGESWRVFRVASLDDYRLYH